MSWDEFQQALKQMNEQQQELTVAPDSWDGADSDAWWKAARAKRDRMQQGLPT